MEKQLTAMQEFRDWIKNNPDVAMRQIKAKSKELLKKERQQITKAYDKGSDVDDDLKPLYGTPEQYFTTTFKQH